MEAVEDGVPEGGFADNVLPVRDGELRAEDGSAASVTVEDLEQVVATFIGQEARLQSARRGAKSSRSVG